MSETQRTLVLLKPRAIQRGLIGTFIQRLENKGYRLLACKQIWCAEQRFEEHYRDLSNESFFPKLVKYMSSGPVMPMVWEGPNAVENVRILIGAPGGGGTSGGPAPGTIRGDFCTSMGHGPVIHASDSEAAAEQEINLWFTEKELYTFPSDSDNWISEIN